MNCSKVPDRSKEESEIAFKNKQRSEKSDEELFLSTYNLDDYDRPSVAADIAAFSIRSIDTEQYRKDAEKKLTVLLIKRGEHPFMNQWALPGGFLRPDETMEECAYREITEETHLKPAKLMPIGVFSEVDRDPRGRIISNAYTSIIGEEQVKIMGGDDAIDAKWFDVCFDTADDGTTKLVLQQEEIILSASLKEQKSEFGKRYYEITENNGLAFDHAKIIATALSMLRCEAGKMEIAFDFLPEKFTLNELQKVQEILIGISLLTANFRRNISNYVDATEEFTSGEGHRPARLYKRRSTGNE